MTTSKSAAALAATAFIVVSTAASRAHAGPPLRVQICHIPPGNPQNRHTITVWSAAVAAHLAHGDTLGPCAAACSERDSDGDQVNDCNDDCPQTPSGEVVDVEGCSILVLRVDAGIDISVTAGEVVQRAAVWEVVQGQVLTSNLVWSWQQVLGEPLTFSSTGANLSFDTFGVRGAFAFRATVSTDDAAVSASDEFVVEVVAPAIIHLAAGKWHNVALFDDSHTVLWGWDRYGQLGDGSMQTGVVHADAAARHTVVASEDGHVFAFGADALSDSATPTQVPGIVDAVWLAGTTEGAAMVLEDGSLWGFAGSAGGCVLGGLSPVDASGNVAVVPIAGAPADVVQVAAGAGHLVALDADGTAWVWGSTRFGCTPRAVLSDVVSVAAGDTEFCLFIREDGSAWGLGFNLHGQLGNGTTVSNYTVPTPVQGVGDVVAIAAGDRHSLFVQADGTLWATGWNRNCQLGLEAEVVPEEPEFPTNLLAPVQVDLANVVLVAGGENHSLAVTADGRVWGWGLNNVGQLHLNTFTTLPGQVCMPMAIEIE